jgi:hypothetical protein
VAKFERGGPGGPGRPRGVKDKLAVTFLEALQKDFEEHGMEAIRIARVEDPVRYVAIIAQLMPKDLQIEHRRFGQLSDEELDGVLEYVRQMRAKLIEQQSTQARIANGRDREKDRVVTR